MGSFSTRLILVWLLCAAVVTLAPFDFGGPSSGQKQVLAGFSADSHQLAPTHLGLNMLLFLPLGALLHHESRRRVGQVFPAVILVCTAALLVSLVVELLQHFLPGRESSFVDMSANTAGAMVGVFASLAWGEHIPTRVDQWRASVSPLVLAGALVGLMTATLLASGLLQARSRLSNWSPAYPLMIGNEHTGDRPWRGRIFSVEITDEAAPLSLMRQFAGGELVRLPGESVAQFDFEEGAAPYRDAAGGAPVLNWTAPTATRGDGSLTVTGDQWLQTHEAASDLVRRIRQTNAFTLRVKCATDDTAQRGPARIFSNSKNPSLRNFTIGQNETDLVVRVRTPLTGLNGTLPQTVVPAVFTTDAARDILITYDGANVVAAVSPTGQIVRTELTPGLSAARTLMRGSNVDVPRQQLVYKVGYLGLLFLPPAVLIALFGRSSHSRMIFRLAYLCAVAIGMEATLMLVSGRGFDASNTVVTAGTGAVVVALISVTLSETDVRRHFILAGLRTHSRS